MLNKIELIIKSNSKNRYLVQGCDSKKCNKGVKHDEPNTVTTHIFDQHRGMYVCMKCGKEFKI